MEEGESFRLTVDGEVFEITERLDLPGQYDFVWITGRNPGYGFSSRLNVPRKRTLEELEVSIRAFLGGINSTTGDMG